MERQLNKVKWSFILMAIVFIVMGIILVAWPDTTTRVICYSLGTIILIYGIFHIISYMSRYQELGYFQMDLIIGLIAAGLGLFMLLKSDVVISILPVILGVTLLVDSFVKLQRSLDLKKAGYDGWKWILLLAGITAVLAVLLLINPFGAASMMVVFIGICLIYNGISELWTIYCMTTYLKDEEIHTADHIIDVEVIEQEDETGRS